MDLFLGHSPLGPKDQGYALARPIWYQGKLVQMFQFCPRDKGLGQQKESLRRSLEENLQLCLLQHT
jgi:hypothetical protein